MPPLGHLQVPHLIPRVSLCFTCSEIITLAELIAPFFRENKEKLPKLQRFTLQLAVVLGWEQHPGVSAPQPLTQPSEVPGEEILPSSSSPASSGPPHLGSTCEGTLPACGWRACWSQRWVTIRALGCLHPLNPARLGLGQAGQGETGARRGVEPSSALAHLPPEKGAPWWAFTPLLQLLLHTNPTDGRAVSLPVSLCQASGLARARAYI